MLATLVNDVHHHDTASVVLLGLAVAAFLAAALVYRDVALTRYRLFLAVGLALFALGVVVA